MKSLQSAGVCAVLAVLASVTVSAGQIYGTIVADGQGLKDTAIEITCGTDAPVAARTAGDGAYRVMVTPQGQCTLALPSVAGRPSIAIFSTPNPTLYNLQLVKLAEGKFELRRRQ